MFLQRQHTIHPFDWLVNVSSYCVHLLCKCLLHALGRPQTSRSRPYRANLRLIGFNMNIRVRLRVCFFANFSTRVSELTLNCLAFLVRGKGQKQTVGCACTLKGSAHYGGLHFRGTRLLMAFRLALHLEFLLRHLV